MLSFTLCFTDIFLDEKVEMNDKKIATTDYKTFLSGKQRDDSMSKIDFRNVTKSLEDYTQGYFVLY
jgi:hypothetical protein